MNYKNTELLHLIDQKHSFDETDHLIPTKIY